MSLARRPHPLLPPVLFHRRQRAGGKALRHPKWPRLTLIGFVIDRRASRGLPACSAAARLNSAVVSAGLGVELSVITAAVLGGASLRGGEGTIIGGVLGVILIALVQNALIINGVGVFWQGIIIGLVLLGAVSLDRFKQAHRG